MRLALLCVVFGGVLRLTAATDQREPARILTVVLDFRGLHSAGAVAAMEHETERIFGSTGIALDWRIRGTSSAETAGTLVLVHFNGKCILEPLPYLYDERGPLAYTYSTNGQIQPFSEVACDQVVSSVRQGMLPGDFSHADLLMGRALGRVLAHELVHILTGEAEHSPDGVTRKSLSPGRLVAPELDLGPQDIDRIRASIRSQR